MPRTVLITMLALCAVSAALGLRAGWQYANLTETDVIEAAIANYVAHETGLGHAPAETDCSARPGEGDVWIVVLCMPLSDAATRRTEYFISRFGRMEKVRGG